MVPWLRLQAHNAGGLGLTPGQEARTHVLQLRVCKSQLKVQSAAAQTRHGQINKYLKKSVSQVQSPTVRIIVELSSVQSLSRVWLFVTPRTAAHLASLSTTNSQSLLKLTSTESVMPSNHLISVVENRHRYFDWEADCSLAGTKTHCKATIIKTWWKGGGNWWLEPQRGCDTSVIQHLMKVVFVFKQYRTTGFPFWKYIRIHFYQHKNKFQVK